MKKTMILILLVVPFSIVSMEDNPFHTKNSLGMTPLHCAFYQAVKVSEIRPDMRVFFPLTLRGQQYGAVLLAALDSNT